MQGVRRQNRRPVPSRSAGGPTDGGPASSARRTALASPSLPVPRGSADRIPLRGRLTATFVPVGQTRSCPLSVTYPKSSVKTRAGVTPTSDSLRPALSTIQEVVGPEHRLRERQICGTKPISVLNNP